MIRYIILYCSTCAVCITMCYLDLFIDNINSILQLFLIHFLSWIILTIGAIKCMPEKAYSNKRVWFYCAAMSGMLAAIKSFVKLIEILDT